MTIREHHKTRQDTSRQAKTIQQQDNTILDNITSINTRQDKTIQDNARQDYIIQDNQHQCQTTTRQSCNNIQYKARHEKARREHDETIQDQTIQQHTRR